MPTSVAAPRTFRFEREPSALSVMRQPTTTLTSTAT